MLGGSALLTCSVDDMLFADSELDEFDDAAAAAAAASIGAGDTSGGEQDSPNGNGNGKAGKNGSSSRRSNKRPRLVFTDIQKRTLQVK